MQYVGIKKTFSLALIFSFGVTGCNIQELADAIKQANDSSSNVTAETGDASDSSVSDCSYAVQSIYQIGLDPTYDFVVHYARVNETVVSSSCDSTIAGETRSDQIEVIYRHGNQVTINNGQAPHVFIASGLGLTTPSTSDCENGYRVKRELSSGAIDTFAQTLKLKTKITYSSDSSCAPQASQNHQPPNSNQGIFNPW